MALCSRWTAELSSGRSVLELGGCGAPGARLLGDPVLERDQPNLLGEPALAVACAAIAFVVARGGLIVIHIRPPFLPSRPRIHRDAKPPWSGRGPGGTERR